MMSLQFPSINFATPEIPDRRMHARYSIVAFHTGDVEDISIPVADDRLAILALRISAWQPLAISRSTTIIGLSTRCLSPNPEDYCEMVDCQKYQHQLSCGLLENGSLRSIRDINLRSNPP